MTCDSGFTDRNTQKMQHLKLKQYLRCHNNITVRKTDEASQYNYTICYYMLLNYDV